MQGASLVGFGAWLSGWRHFFSWKGRIGGGTFFGGYIVLCFVGGALGVLGIGILDAVGTTDIQTIKVMAFVLIGALFVPLSALFAQRAHDLGWSAFIPLGLFAVLGAPMLTLLDFGVGLFGGLLSQVASSAGLDRTSLYPLAMAGNGLWIVFAIFMMIKPGQGGANRFGPSPASA